MRTPITSLIEHMLWMEDEEMPLTKKGKKIKRAMAEQYGPQKGERVFYASQSKGTITGTHKRGAKRGR